MKRHMQRAQRAANEQKPSADDYSHISLQREDGAGTQARNNKSLKKNIFFSDFKIFTCYLEATTSQGKWNLEGKK